MPNPVSKALENISEQQIEKQKVLNWPPGYRRMVV